MAVSYELMDLDSGNLVGSYLTLDDAFAIIRDAYVVYGWSGVNDLGLVRVGNHDSQDIVAIGSELARLAMAEANGTPDAMRGERTA
jgi:hypothetical protein